MDQSLVFSLIQEAFPEQDTDQTWADLGAGSGTFTRALIDLLPTQSTVYAIDKSPHLLWDLASQYPHRVLVHEGDFLKFMELPPLDGILIANALHYAPDTQEALLHLLSYLKKGGKFILIEYDISRPVPTWIPYPVSWERFQEIAPKVGLSRPKELRRIRSGYGHSYLYSCVASRL